MTTATTTAGTGITDPPSLDTVHQCDNLNLLRRLGAGTVDLIYIDPPFNTGKQQRGTNRSDDELEEPSRYADSWPTMSDYLSFIRPRLMEMHRILKPSGSMLLHCDWRSSHHLRLLLDEIFGAECFVNHLIWSYGLGGSSPRRFARKHDDILFYGRSEAYYFEPPRIPATSARMRGQTKKATDVLDIPSINNMAAERTGYPTQKPLALLEVLIEACCPADGVVADFFCGSGTTLVAAANLGRRWIGCDVSAEAVKIVQQRLGQSR